MSTITQFRLAVPVPDTRARMPLAVDEQIINLTLETDDKLLLTVVEAAHRLGIARTLMYEPVSYTHLTLPTIYSV